MTKKLPALLSGYCEEYALINENEGERLLIMLFPFEPFRNDGKTPYIDAYFLRSNEAYHATKELAARIKKETGVPVSGFHTFGLKPAAVSAGLCSGGYRNSLTYHSVYGSYFNIQALRLFPPAPETDTARAGNGSKRVELRKTTHVPEKSSCADCESCVSACPMGAIGEGGCIDKHKCIRHHMSTGFKNSEKAATEAKNNIIGCHYCQAACPLNAGIAKQLFPEELTKLIYKFQNDKDPAELRKIIGANLAKKELLEALVGNAVRFCESVKHCP